MGSYNYTPSGDLSSKTILVTGGSSGVGKQSCFEFARLNAGLLIIAGRNEEKSRQVIAQIKEKYPASTSKIEFLKLELDDLESVRNSASSLLSRPSNFKIDILLNNAGIASLGGVTKQGFELAFGTNHLGHFLFTEMILPIVKRASPGSRIVFVSSEAHKTIKTQFDWNNVKTADNTIIKFQAYGQSKIANALYSKKLSIMLKESGITTYSLHPGVVSTDIWKAVPWPLQPIFKFFMINEEDGAKTQLKCCLDPALATETGLYYDQCTVAKSYNPLIDNVEYVDSFYAKSLEAVAPWRK